MIKVIKSYEVFTARYENNPQALPYDAHLAVAETQAFYAKAKVMIPKVSDPYARAVIAETLANLLALTQEQKPVVKASVTL